MMDRAHPACAACGVRTTSWCSFRCKVLEGAKPVMDSAVVREIYMGLKADGLDVNGLQIFRRSQAVFDADFTVADGGRWRWSRHGAQPPPETLVGLNEERRGAMVFDGIDISQMPANVAARPDHEFARAACCSTR